MQFIITIMHGEERKLRKKEKQQIAFNVQQLVSEGNINQPNRIGRGYQVLLEKACVTS